jgi:hypothetical protein
MICWECDIWCYIQQVDEYEFDKKMQVEDKTPGKGSVSV